MKIKPKIRRAWSNHSRVKCDCGHYPKDHYTREGACDKCGCNWYWPNGKYQLRKQKEKKEWMLKSKNLKN